MFYGTRRHLRGCNIFTIAWSIMGPWLPSEAPHFDSQLNAAQNKIERLQAKPIDIIIIATCWLAKAFSSESRQLDASETENNTEYNFWYNVILKSRYAIFNVDQYSIIACICLHDMDVCVHFGIIHCIINYSDIVRLLQLHRLDVEPFVAIQVVFFLL